MTASISHQKNETTQKLATNFHVRKNANAILKSSAILFFCLSWVHLLAYEDIKKVSI
jgi:hypothetical protein